MDKDKLDDIDHLPTKPDLHPDHVDLSVVAQEEEELDYEDVENESENEEIQDDVEQDIANIDHSSIADTDSVVTFKQRRVIPRNDNDFCHLMGNPTFERFIQKRVLEEMSQKKSVKSKVVDKRQPNTPDKRQGQGNGNLLKSSSDTTLYTPALKRAVIPRSQRDILPNSLANEWPDLVLPNQQSVINDQIAKFVENMWIQTTPTPSSQQDVAEVAGSKNPVESHND